MEELALPMRGIQLLGEELSTDEAASAELRKAEAVHWTRNSHRLFKVTPTTPCICQEQQLETGVSNKCLKCMLEFYSAVAVRPSRGCFVPRCRTRRRLCGWEPPGPNPHTTILNFKQIPLTTNLKTQTSLPIRVCACVCACVSCTSLSMQTWWDQVHAHVRLHTAQVAETALPVPLLPHSSHGRPSLTTTLYFSAISVHRELGNFPLSRCTTNFL